jgi:hypothetical protein
VLSICIVDVDFSIVSDKLSVEWNNFHHPHLDLYFNVCAGTTIGGCDVTMEERIDGSISTFNVNLQRNLYIFTRRSNKGIIKYFCSNKNYGEDYAVFVFVFIVWCFDDVICMVTMTTMLLLK